MTKIVSANLINTTCIAPPNKKTFLPIKFLCDKILIMGDASMSAEQGESKSGISQELKTVSSPEKPRQETTPQHGEELIVPKTPEQLKTQATLVNIHRSLSDYNQQPIPLPPELLEATPQVLKTTLEAERERIKREGGRSELLDNYNSFVKSLRKVRQEQRPQIEKAIQEADDLTLRKEAYLKAVSFSSPLQSKILDNMQGENYRYSVLNRRLFTDEQIQSANENEEAFLELISYGLERSPLSIFNGFEQLEMLLPRGKIRSVLDTLAQQEPFMFIEQFDRIYKYYETDERKAVILKAHEAQALDKTALFIYFNKPEISQLFSKEEGRELLLSSSTNLYTSAVKTDRIDTYVKEGFLTEADVRNIIIGLIQRQSDGVSTVNNFMKYFPESQRELLKQEIIKAATRENNTPILRYFTELNILTDDEKRIIVKHSMQHTDANLMTTDLDLMIQFLPPDEVKTYLKDAIKKNAVNHWSHVTKLILEGSLLSPQEKLDFLQTALDNYPPYVLLDDLELYIKHYPPEMRPAFVKQLIEKAPVGSAISNLNKWIIYLADNPEDQKALITRIILRENNFSFLTVYNNKYIPNNLLQALYTQEEIKDLLYKQTELGSEKVFGYFKDIRKILGSDSELKVFVAYAGRNDPYSILRNFEQLAYLYTTDEARNFIEKVPQDSRGTSACIETVDLWGNIVGKEYCWNFLQKFVSVNAQDFPPYLSRLLPYVPLEKRQIFLYNLIGSNPPNALDRIDIFKGYLPDLTQEEIITQGQSDQERLSYAPKTLASFYKDIARVKDGSQRNALLAEAIEEYLYIAAIKDAGLVDDFRKVQSAQEVPIRLEHELLSIFECYALIKNKDPQSFARIGSLGNNAQEAKQILFGELGKRFGITRAINEEEIGRLFGELESPAPFLTYLFQYESSQEHKTLLSGMFETTLAGKYSEWKFGAQNHEAFDELKRAKLLPQNLTYEQYDIWRRDEDTMLHEALAANAHSVVSAIKQLLLDNNEDLGVEAFDIEDTTPQQIFKDIQNNLSSIGQELASMNKRLSELRKIVDGTTTNEFQNLSNRKEEIEQVRRAVLKNRNFMKLANLKPQEVSSGYLLEGEDLKKKVAPIGKVIEELKSQIPEDGLFVLDRVEKLLQSFYGQTQEKQNLTRTDSSSPKVLIEIGEKPVGSCQHYAHGSHNDCLLGYSDPNTKILVLRNEKGNSVARSIFRLLTTSDGKPALHIERIYSSTASQGVLRSIYTHAYRKAKEIGIPLFVSQESQNEQGAETGVQVPSGFEAVPVEFSLVSEASRAPKVYVDSAGGERSWGNYKMDNLLEINATTT